MELGSPVSQVLGVFHGRAEALSDSGLVAHPAKASDPTISPSRKTIRNLGLQTFMTMPDARE